MKLVYVRAVLRIHRHTDGLGRAGGFVISGNVLYGQDAEVDATELTPGDVEGIQVELAQRLEPAARVFIRASGDTAATIAWALRFLADEEDLAAARTDAEDEVLKAWAADVDASHVDAIRAEAGQ